MKKTNYLNVILTANALLLAGLLWTQIADSPVLVEDAAAVTTAPPFNGVPNAGRQREEIVKAVNALAKDVQKTNQLLEKEIKVTVTNVNALRSESSK